MRCNTTGKNYVCKCCILNAGLLSKTDWPFSSHLSIWERLSGNSIRDVRRIPVWLQRAAHVVCMYFIINGALARTRASRKHSNKLINVRTQPAHNTPAPREYTRTCVCTCTHDRLHHRSAACSSGCCVQNREWLSRKRARADTHACSACFPGNTNFVSRPKTIM